MGFRHVSVMSQVSKKKMSRVRIVTILNTSPSSSSPSWDTPGPLNTSIVEKPAPFSSLPTVPEFTIPSRENRLDPLPFTLPTHVNGPPNPTNITNSNNNVPTLPNTTPATNTANSSNTIDADNSHARPPPLPPLPPLSPLSALPPSPPPTPVVRRSSRIPTPSVRLATNDGLHHGPRLAAAITESRLSGVRRQEERIQRSLTPQADHAFAILSEYSEVRDTHDLLHADLCFEDIPLSVDEALAALSDGSLEPTVEPDDEPSWAQALASPEREFWIAGGREELKSLEDLKVFVLVPRSEVPRGHRPLKGKLVCKQKRDDTGKVVRYKVRYVAKGFAQRWGIDYDKTTAPTVRLESFRSILHIAANLDWDVQQFDIKTAFLHGILPEDETMFMEQPKGFEAPGKEDWVMHLMKSIYGMKQASRIWNQTFHNAVTQWGFERLECEWCVYRRQSASGITIFVLHVDDILSASSNPDDNSWFRDKLKAQWDISDLGPTKFALG